MAQRVDILTAHTPIVDDKGRPTPEFMLQWRKQVDVNLSIPELESSTAVSLLLDLIGSDEGDILRRGSTAWDVLAASADADTFLNGNGAYTAVSESGLSLSDNTTGNATTGRHGLLPKLSGAATEYLDGSGAFSTPAGGSGASSGNWLIATPGSAASDPFCSQGPWFTPLVDISISEILARHAFPSGATWAVGVYAVNGSGVISDVLIDEVVTPTADGTARWFYYALSSPVAVAAEQRVAVHIRRTSSTSTTPVPVYGGSAGTVGFPISSGWGYSRIANLSPGIGDTIVGGAANPYAISIKG